jgi:hypothetical protein
MLREFESKSAKLGDEIGHIQVAKNKKRAIDDLPTRTEKRLKNCKHVQYLDRERGNTPGEGRKISQ